MSFASSQPDLPEGKTPLRLLQITDTHLFGDYESDLLGVATRRSFESVIEQILDEKEEFDMVVITGDISQDHSINSYIAFAEQLERLKRPCFWLPGNHDDPLVMASGLSQVKLASVGQILLPNWQLLLLDSQVVGKVYGELSERQLDWIDTAISEHPDRQALVLLHHNPVPMGSKWLDQHTLRNGEQFLQRLEAHPQIHGVVWGHVHQESDTQRNGLRLISTPSTCIQFKPDCDDFTLDTRQPGYRYLTLHPDGAIDTQVHRLPEGMYLPQSDAQGY